MSKYFQIKSFSAILLLVFTSLFIVDLISTISIYKYLALNINDILSNHQYWKLLTYSLVPSSIEDVLLFIAVFVFIAPRLEQILSTKYMIMLASAYILIQGAFLNLIIKAFDYYMLSIQGMEGLSIFILTLSVLIYSFSNKRDKLDISIQSILIMLGTFVIIKISRSIFSENPSIIFTIVSSFLAIVLGILTFFIASYNRKKEIDFQSIMEDDDLPKIPDVKELTPELISINSLQQNQESNELFYPILSSDPRENEDTLNLILDKINSSGKDSLNYEELAFLTDYSKLLNK